jgi:hypothetical protein
LNIRLQLILIGPGFQSWRKNGISHGAFDQPAELCCFPRLNLSSLRPPARGVLDLRSLSKRRINQR